jgi:hypothetical protein
LRPTRFLDKYCLGDYANCARYAYAKVYGRTDVPLEMFPNDTFEDPYGNAYLPDGGESMQIKVIFPDGTTGQVKAAHINSLIKEGKVVAFYCSEGWIEVRRKRENRYNGPERRQIPAY